MKNLNHLILSLFFIFIYSNSSAMPGGGGGGCASNPDYAGTLICESCENPCGTCGIENPDWDIDQVLAECDEYEYNPVIEECETDTRCHQFTAVDTEADFNVIINSTCDGGNVTNFSWELYESGNCGTLHQDGDLGGLTFTGLDVGQTYTFCYTYSVPSGCYHTYHVPFFIGAETVELPVELYTFAALELDEVNHIKWTTATETNNSYFTIFHSTNGEEWKEIGKIDGVGNSSAKIHYSYDHRDYIEGINYYKLTQTDFDGTTEFLGIKSVHNKLNIHKIKTVNLMGQEVNEFYKGIVVDYFSDGTTSKRMQ